MLEFRKTLQRDCRLLEKLIVVLDVAIAAGAEVILVGYDIFLVDPELPGELIDLRFERRNAPDRCDCCAQARDDVCAQGPYVILSRNEGSLFPYARSFAAAQDNNSFPLPL